MRALVRSRALRFRSGNRVELFDNGRDGLAAMLDAIRTAAVRIHLETYILRSDVTGRRFLDALATRARAGVEVRLLYDAIGSRGLDRRALDDLLGAGAQVVAFNPLARGLISRALRRRCHRKLLLIDDRVGFVGGLNIGDEYAAEVAGVPSWRDAHSRIEGPVLRDLQALFLESWFRAGGPHLPWLELLEAEPATCGDARCAVLADGPSHARRRMRDVLVSALDEAQENVLLVTPYLAPGSSILRSIAAAARRGVCVELLLAGRTDHPILRHSARAILPPLLEAGVRVYEDPARMMHAKLAAFDDSLGIVGTSNLDRQSLHHSYEVDLLVEGPRVAAWVRERFGHATADVAPVDATALQRRGWFLRLLDRIAALLVGLL